MWVEAILWLVIAACQLYSSDAHAAAWTLEDGQWQIITTVSAERADRAFDSSGRSVDRPSFEKYSARALVEYGMTNWLTLLVEPGFERVAIDMPAGKETEQGLNSTGFGGRLRLYNGKKYIASVQGTFYVPGQLRTTETTVLSYGSFDADARLLLGGGGSLKLASMQRPYFWDLEVAYRWRSHEPANELHADFTAGLQLQERLQLLGQSFNIASAMGQTAEARKIFPPFYLCKVQFSGVYKVTDRVSVQVGGFRDLTGRNIIEEEGVFSALWLKF